MKHKTSKYIAAIIIVLGVLFIYFISSITISKTNTPKDKIQQARNIIERHINGADSLALFDNIEAVPAGDKYINLYGRCITVFNNSDFKINERSLLAKTKIDSGEIPDKIIFFGYKKFESYDNFKCYWYYYDKYNYYWSFDEMKTKIEKRNGG